MSSTATHTGKIESVQALRAIAAFAVVFHHTGLALMEYYPKAFTDIGQKFVMLGAAGVDLFFVISGYIIYRTTTKLRGTPGEAHRFLVKRALRIYPNYWVWTSVLLLAWIAGFALKSHQFKTSFIVSSYLLLPTMNSDALLHPLLDQGWTLSFEMYFYLVFSLLIPIHWNMRNPLWISVPFVLFAGIAYILNFPSNIQSVIVSPLICEFLLGVGIGWMLSIFKPPSILGIVPAILATFAWALALAHGKILGIGADRLLIYGIPSGLTLISALMCKPIRVLHYSTWFGDASYSIYLVHGFFTMALSMALKRYSGTVIQIVTPEVLCLIFAIVIFMASSLAYILVEKPISRIQHSLRHNS